MCSQTMLYSFRFAFVRQYSQSLILVDMDMIKDENFDASSSRSGSSTTRDDHGDRNESFWQNKCPRFVHGNNE